MATEHNAADRADGLKPCPFCGSRNIETVRNEDEVGLYFVLCDNCKAEGPILSYLEYTESRELSERLWNTRAPRPEGERLSEIYELQKQINPLADDFDAEEAADILTRIGELSFQPTPPAQPEAEPTGERHCIDCSTYGPLNCPEHGVEAVMSSSQPTAGSGEGEAVSDQFTRLVLALTTAGCGFDLHRACQKRHRARALRAADKPSVAFFVANSASREVPRG